MNDRFIGNYKILRQIGSGGMAKVYLAVHKDIPNLRVILKILTDNRQAERFRHEADKLALLDNNPKICRIRDFFTHDDDFVIAMDFIDGETLEQKIKAAGKIPVNEAISIILDVLDVLEFAHDLGIFHRDIKPGNVMIDKADRVKVIDFGIAKSEGDPRLTMVDAYCGTPAYMSPEQFGKSDQTDYTRADIYSVGVTLYEMVCGELPFKESDIFTLRDAKLFKTPPSPAFVVPELSEELDGIIMKAMEKEPGNRFASAREMRLAIQTELDKELVQPENLTPTPPPMSKSHRKKSRKVPVIMTVLLVLAAVAYFAFPTLKNLMGLSSKLTSESGGNKTSKEVPSPSPHLPARPILQFPVNNETVSSDGRLTFSWSSGDNDVKKFRFEYALDSSFNNIVESEITPAVTYKAKKKFDHPEYYWRVWAFGTDTTEKTPSAIASFTVQSTPSEKARQVADGTLRVYTDRKADIYVNGALASEDALDYAATSSPGRYALRIVDNESGAVREDTVEIDPDQTTRREYSFAETASGALSITTRPDGAEVIVDGQPQGGKSTPCTINLTPGQHTVVVKDARYSGQSQQKTVNVSGTKTAEVSFTFDSFDQLNQIGTLSDVLSRVRDSIPSAARDDKQYKSALALVDKAEQSKADGNLESALKDYKSAIKDLQTLTAKEIDREQGIQAAIDRLRMALQDRSVDSLKKVYPGIPSKEQKDWATMFSNVSDYTVEMKIDKLTRQSDDALADLSIRMVFKDTGGEKFPSFKWRVRLAEKSNDWVIVNRETIQ